MKLKTVPESYEELPEEHRIIACDVAQEALRITLAQIDAKLKNMTEEAYWRLVSATLDLAKRAFIETVNELVTTEAKNAE